MHGVFDLGGGHFSHLAVTDRHGAESMARSAVPAGEIRIGDRNDARAGVLEALCRTAGTVDLIVRMGWRALALTTPSGGRFDHLQTLPDDMAPHEVRVLARTGRHTPLLPLRLVMGRKPPEASLL